MMSSLAQKSPWHSPVPYLFGGLAAMLGLIAFALLILACSYWKLSGYLEGGDSAGGDRDIELGGEGFGEKPKLHPVFEEKILVIMAGEVMPTFLATPVTSRASSFGSNSSGTSEQAGETEEGRKEKPKQGNGDQGQTRSTENRETSDQIP